MVLPYSIIQDYRGKRPFRTLLLLYRQDLRYIGLSMMFYVIKHSPEWLRPLILANIIDIISTPSQHAFWELWLNGAIFAVSVVQNIPTHYLYVRFMSLATRRMESRLRAALIQRLQELSLEFYYQNSTGLMQSKLLRDVESIQLLTSQLFEFLPSALLTILIALIVTGIRVPSFLLFFLATVPLTVILMRVLIKPLSDRNQKLRQQYETMSAYLVEMVKLIPITRAHGAESTEIDRTHNKLILFQEAAMRVDRINAIAGAASWVTLRLFGCLCLIVSAVLAYKGQFGVTAGSVVLLTGYFDSLTTSILQILAVLPQIGRGFDAIRSVGEILECPQIEPNHGKILVTEVRGAFTFESVGFTYPYAEKPALADFSLAVSPGETIAIVGASGAGKSTLLNLIIGFLRPSAGRIFLDGRDLNTLDLRTYRRFLSVVSQETILFEGTVEENILYGTAGASETQLRQAIEDANALEFIEELPQGLNTPIGENGVRLSGGQRQRIAIARALIRNPRVLLLDEATASLDSASESLIQEALERLMGGRTTFVVAHRLSTIRKADRIIVLEAGRIVESGSLQQLLDNQGLFARLYALQMSKLPLVRLSGE
ncbi:MAG: ABC transporter ATP-binding protein [Hydrococcus sp. C42_A2020_068]|nr:ABC transporter ATP-binding protein [Hydrococcus sp. C42_A2020_068]